MRRLLILGTSLLFACPGGEDDGIVGGPIDAGFVEQTMGIGPAGGTLVSADGVVELVIPPGAVDVETEFSIVPDFLEPPGNLGTAYEIGPSGTQFNVPATMTFRTQGLTNDPGLLRVATFENGDWVPLEGPVIDPNASTITGLATHLSPFSLVAVAGLPSCMDCGDMIQSQGAACNLSCGACDAASPNQQVCPDPGVPGGQVVCGNQCPAGFMNVGAGTGCAPGCASCIVCAPMAMARCGDMACNGDERCDTCPQDCGMCTDTDGDGVNDDVDNCVFEANPGQEDTDGDGIGDVCDRDVAPDGLRGFDRIARDESYTPRFGGRFHDKYRQLALTSANLPMGVMLTECEPDAACAENCVANLPGMTFLSGAVSADDGETFVVHLTRTDDGPFDQIPIQLDDTPADSAQTHVFKVRPGGAEGLTFLADSVIDARSIFDDLRSEGLIAVDAMRVGLTVTEAHLATGTDGGHLVLAAYLRFDEDDTNRQRVPILVGLSRNDLSRRWIVRLQEPSTRERTNRRSGPFDVRRMRLRIAPDGRMLSFLEIPESQYQGELNTPIEIGLPVESRVPADGAIVEGRRINLTLGMQALAKPRLYEVDAAGRLYATFIDIPTERYRCSPPSDIDGQTLRIYDANYRLLTEIPLDPDGNYFSMFIDTRSDQSGGQRRTDLLFERKGNDPFRQCGGGSSPLILERRTFLEDMNDPTSHRLENFATIAFGGRDGAGDRYSFDGAGNLIMTARMILFDANGVPSRPRGFTGAGQFRSLTADLVDTPPQGAEPRFIGTAGTGGTLGLTPMVVGRAGGTFQTFSAVATAGREEFARARANLFVPAGPDHIIQISNGRQLSVLERTDEFAREFEMTFPGVDDAIPVLDPCESANRLSCPAFPRGVTDLTPEFSAEFGTVACNPTLQPGRCTSPVLANLWNNSTLGGGRDRTIITEQGSSRCLPENILVTERMANGAVLFQCPQWQEVIETHTTRPPSLEDTISITNIKHSNKARGETCDAPAQAVPFRIYTVRGGDFEITVTDAMGNETNDLDIGERANIRATANNANFRFTIESNNAVFTSGNALEETNSGQDVEIEATGEGLIVVEIQVFIDGRLVKTQRVTLLVEGERGCVRQAEDLRACSVLPPSNVPQANALESRNSPAIAAGHVLLHDRSFITHERDLLVKSTGMDFALFRTYRSAHPHTDGGILGGWTFGFDERLVGIEQASLQSGMPNRCEIDSFGRAQDRLQMAFFDSTGHVDVFRHPGTSTRQPFPADRLNAAAFLTYNFTTDMLEATAFEADVIEYDTPDGRFETLRSFTIRPVNGDNVEALHPFFDVQNPSVGSLEARFYEMTSPDGMRRIFNCRGQLIRKIDPSFQEIELVYDGEVNELLGARELSQIIDTNGRVYEIEWGSAGAGSANRRRIRGVFGPYGRQVRYVYADHPTMGAILSQVQYRFDGVQTAGLPAPTDAAVVQTLQYRYDGDGRLIEIVAPDDTSQARITYNNGMVASLSLGRETTAGATEIADQAIWTFAGAGNNVTVTDPRGVVYTNTLGALTNGQQVVTSQSHEVQVFDGNLAAPATTAGTHTTSFAHTDDGLITRIDYPSGRSTERRFNERGSLEQQTENAGPGGGAAKVTSFTREPRCQMVTQRSAPGDGAQIVTTYTVADLDVTQPGLTCKRTSKVMPSTRGLTGDVQYTDSYEFIGTGPLRGLLQRKTRTGAGQTVRVEEHAYDDGSQSRTAASLHGKTAFFSLGHPRSLTTSGDNPAVCTGNLPAMTVIEYMTDERGNVIRETTRRAAGDVVEERVFDLKDRLVTERSGTASLPGETTISYDSRDRIILEVSTVTDHFTDRDIPADQPREYVQRFFYDRLNRQTARVTGNGELFELIGYDKVGNVVRRVMPGAGVEPAVGMAVLTMLDNQTPMSELVQSPMLDPSVNPATYPADGFGPQIVHEMITYDASSLQVSRTLTDGGTNSAADPFLRTSTQRWFRAIEGNELLFDPGRTDRAGVFVERRYDGHLRPTSIRVLDPACAAGTALQETVLSQYDERDLAGEIEVRGDVADPGLGIPASGIACSNPRTLMTTVNEYDDSGRLFSERKTAVLSRSAPTSGRTQWTLTTDRAFDDLGHTLRNRTIGENGDFIEQSFGRTYFGKACLDQTRVRHRGVVGQPYKSVQQSYDEAGLRTALNVRHEPNAAGITPVTAQETYVHDARRRLVSRTDAVNRTWTHFYDSLGRERAKRDPADLIKTTRFDDVGRAIETTERADGEVRTRTLIYRANYLVDEILRATVGNDRSYAYDVAGHTVFTFPHGRGMSNLVTVRGYDEAGNLRSMVTPSGATHVYVNDGLGNAVSISATRPANPPAGYGAAPDETKRFLYNGLGQITRGETSIKGQDLTRNLRTINTFGHLISEAQQVENRTGLSSITSGAGGEVDEFGHVTSLDYPGALNQPDVTFDVDPAGRVLRITPDADARVSAPFSRVNPIEYAYVGDMAARRTITATTGERFISLWRYDENAKQVAIQHHQGSQAADQQFYESRHYYFQNRLAATTSLFQVAGAAQGNLRLRLDALGRTAFSSHLTAVPNIRTINAPNFTGRNTDTYGSTYTFFQRNDFGEVLESQTVSWGAEQANANVNFTFKTLDGWRLTNEQTITWNPMPTLQNGSATMVQNMRSTAAFELTPPAMADEERARETCHRVVSMPSNVSLPGGPLGAFSGGCGSTPAGDVRQDAYEVGYTSTGLVRSYKSGETVGDLYNYDLFDRLISVGDGTTQQIETPEVASRQINFYDAFDRRIVENFEYRDRQGNAALASDIPNERPRHFVYWNDEVIQESEFLAPTSDSVRYAYLLGPANDLPYTTTPFGEQIVLEDTQGTFVMFFDTDGGVFRTRSDATASNTGFKPHPILTRTDGSTLRSAIDWFQGNVPDEVFRKVSRNDEAQPFARNSSFSAQTGHRTQLTEYPDLSLQLADIASEQRTFLFVKAGLLIGAAIVAPYAATAMFGTVGAGLAVAFEVTMLAYAAAEIGHIIVEDGGLTLESGVYVALTMLGVMGPRMALTQYRKAAVAAKLARKGRTARRIAALRGFRTQGRREAKDAASAIEAAMAAEAPDALKWIRTKGSQCQERAATVCKFLWDYGVEAEGMRVYTPGKREVRIPIPGTNDFRAGNHHWIVKARTDSGQTIFLDPDISGMRGFVSLGEAKEVARRQWFGGIKGNITDEISEFRSADFLRQQIQDTAAQVHHSQNLVDDVERLLSEAIQTGYIDEAAAYAAYDLTQQGVDVLQAIEQVRVVR